MRVGENYSKSYPLIASEVEGKKAVKVGEKGGYLVKLDPDAKEWSLVDSVEKGISAEELKDSYGLWNDRELTSGALFWKKTLRPLDGKIQGDEVREFQKEPLETTRQVEKTYSNSKNNAATVIFDILQPESRIEVKSPAEGAFIIEKWTCIEHKITSM
jgi:hypothetical protein